MADDTIQQESLAQMGVKVNRLCTALLEWLPGIEEASFDNLPSKREISDQIERFELWAVDLGLYHAGHSSIDYRFRDSAPLFEYTFQLLQDAENDLAHYLAPGEVREAVADDLNLKPLEVNADIEDDEDQASSSDDEDFEVEEDLLSSQAVSLPQAYFASFTTTIDRLYRLALRVRNPAMRVGLSSAISYTEVDADTGIDLIQQYAVLDHSHIINLFASYYTAGVEIPPDLEENYLVKRLAKANTRRRQQFRYWKRRKAQFIAHSVPAIDQQFQPETKILKENVHSSGLSEPSTATALAKGAHNIHNDTLSVVSTSTFIDMTKGKESDKVFVPPPPSIPETAKEFECPFCFMICPRKTFLGRAWETHIFRDLRPFVCTYEDCREGQQQYDKLRDWIAHETGKHQAPGDQGETDTRPECPICPAKSVNAVHVASHLRRIASFALPAWTIEPESDIGGSVEAEANLDSQSRHLSDIEDLTTDNQQLATVATVDRGICPGKTRHRGISKPPGTLNMHVCPVCESTFTKKQDLKRHLQERNPPRWWICPICRRQFPRSDRALEHVRRHLPYGTESLPEIVAIERDQIFPDACHCGEGFSSWDEWFQHLFAHRATVLDQPHERDLLASSSQELESTDLASPILDPILDLDATPLASPTFEPLLGQTTSDISRSSSIDRAQEGAALTEELRQETIEKEDANKATH